MSHPRGLVRHSVHLLFTITFLFLLSPLCSSQPSDPSYVLVWQEEFLYSNGSQPSASVWNWDIGNGDWGWGNDELEYYTSSTLNSAVDGDVLTISGLYQPDYLSTGFDFTSARINTEGKLAFYQGYVAARATINMFNGFWPAMSADQHCSIACGLQPSARRYDADVCVLSCRARALLSDGRFACPAATRLRLSSSTHLTLPLTSPSRLVRLLCCCCTGRWATCLPPLAGRTAARSTSWSR
jgi:hypothetical protein